jgi:HEAT repeat protein
MSTKYITRLLKVHPGDIGNLVNLSILNLLVVMLHSYGASVVTSLLIKRYGVGFLPKMYVISACAVVVCTLAVLKLGSVRRSVLLTAACAVFGALVIAARALLYLDIPLACPVLYVLGDFVALFFFTQFWALAVEVCDVREGKRIFTYLVCAGLIGGGLAGAGVNFLAQRLGSNDLVTLWAVLFFAVALYIKRNVPDRAPAGAVTEKEAAVPFTAQLKDTAFYFTKSGHVRILLACVLLSVVSSYFLDFVFNKVMDRTFPDERGLTAFYGTYSLWFYSGTLFVQLFLTNRVVKALGTSNALLLLPAWVTFGFGSMMAAFGYFASVTTRFFKDLIGSSFSDSVIPLLFSPIKDRFRDSTIAIAEGLVTPLGTALAGGMLILIANAPDRAAVAVGLSFALLWIYFGFRLKKSYQAAFISNLAEKSLPDISAIEDLGNMSTRQAAQALALALRSDDDQVSYFAMRALRGDAASTDLLARYLEEGPSNDRKANLLYFLGGAADSEKYRPLIERSLADRDALVRARAVGAFFQAQDAATRDRILPFLHDPDIRVQVNAVMVLWKFGAQKEFFDILSRAAKDPLETARNWAVFALCRLSCDESVPLLVELSRDRHPSVKLHAIKGLGQRGTGEANARLLALLNDKSRKVRQAAGKALAGNDGAAEFLIQTCETGTPAMRDRCISLLAAREEGGDIVFRHLESELAAIYKRIVWADALRKEEQTPALELFIATLINKNRRALEKLLAVSSKAEGSTAFGLIIKRLKDRDSRSFAEALELLETMNLHKKSFLRSVISLLEKTPERELAEYGRRNLGIREYSARDIYAECLASPAHDWFRGCAEHIVRENQERA